VVVLDPGSLYDISTVSLNWRDMFSALHLKVMSRSSTITALVIDELQLLPNGCLTKQYSAVRNHKLQCCSSSKYLLDVLGLLCRAEGSDTIVKVSKTIGHMLVCLVPAQHQHLADYY
jgi:hypothetical protein